MNWLYFAAGVFAGILWAVVTAAWLSALARNSQTEAVRGLTEQLNAGIRADTKPHLIVHIDGTEYRVRDYEFNETALN